ncbi:hypothetical protein Dimus_025683 [Dionaea muscipula]
MEMKEEMEDLLLDPWRWSMLSETETLPLDPFGWPTLCRTEINSYFDPWEWELAVCDDHRDQYSTTAIDGNELEEYSKRDIDDDYLNLKIHRDSSKQYGNRERKEKQQIARRKGKTTTKMIAADRRAKSTRIYI